MHTVVFAVRSCPVTGLGPYGNEWVATPTLDALAADGAVFDRHLSDCPDPAAAHRAWRTGTAQTPRRDGRPAPPAAGPDLFAALRAAGVLTVHVDHTRCGPDPEFYAGSAERFAAGPDPADPTPTAALLRALPRVAAAVERHAGPALIWIDTDRLVPPWDAPQDVFDAYIEDVFDVTPDDPAARESTLDADAILTADADITTIDPTAAEYVEEIDVPDDEPRRRSKPAKPVIAPWLAPPAGWFDRDDFASWELLHRTFAAAVTQFDADLGKILAALDGVGLSSAAVVVTSDRGQALGEHGVVGPHRPWLHEELVHLPLVVRVPGTPGGLRSAALTVPADLMPTLLDLHGVPAPPGVDGVSVLAHFRPDPPPARAAVATGLVTPEASEWAVRTASWAYLAPGTGPPDDDPRGPMLFVKPDDRHEANDVLIRFAEVGAEMEATLTAAAGLAGPTAGG